jgi:hypothetical protein
MQANRDSIMKPAAAARRYRGRIGGPRPKPVGADLCGACLSAVGVRFMFRS